MTEDNSVECPYCGEVFHDDDEMDAVTKEGIHRAQKHVNNQEETTRTNKGKNIVDKWKSEGKRA